MYLRSIHNFMNCESRINKPSAVESRRGLWTTGAVNTIYPGAI